MKRILASAVAAITIISAGALHAATVTFAYEARVTRAITQQSNPNIPDLRRLLRPGDMVQGTITYEINQPSTGPSSSFRIYETGFNEITLDTSAFSSQFSTVSDPSIDRSASITLSKDALLDRIRVNANNTPSGGIGINESIEWSLRDDTKTALSALSLPTDIDLADFSDGLLANELTYSTRVLEPFGNSIFARGSALFTAEITSLHKVSAVPLPATGLILLAGLAGFGIVRRKRKTQIT